MIGFAEFNVCAQSIFSCSAAYSFAVLCSLNVNLLFTAVVPSKTIPDSIPKWESSFRLKQCKPYLLGRGGTYLVTKCCIYNQFSVAFILHSNKAYFFTCSYFRILCSVLHLKDSSTSMRAKLDDLNSIHTLVQLNISERLHSSNKKLSFQITWRVFPPQWRNNF